MDFRVKYAPELELCLLVSIPCISCRIPCISSRILWISSRILCITCRIPRTSSRIPCISWRYLCACRIPYTSCRILYTSCRISCIFFSNSLYCPCKIFRVTLHSVEQKLIASFQKPNCQLEKLWKLGPLFDPHIATALLHFKPPLFFLSKRTVFLKRIV